MLAAAMQKEDLQAHSAFPLLVLAESNKQNVRTCFPHLIRQLFRNFTKQLDIVGDANSGILVLYARVFNLIVHKKSNQTLARFRLWCVQA